MALQTQDPESLDRTAANIQGRSARICAVVDAEMLNYEPGLYTDKVSDAVLILKQEGWLFLHEILKNQSCFWNFHRVMQAVTLSLILSNFQECAWQQS